MALLKDHPCLVREFKAKDVKRLTKLLGKVKLPPTDEDARAYGLAIIQTAVQSAADEVWEWLADMAGMKPGEFDEQPASAVIEVIEGIAKQESARDFFGRLAQVFGKASAKTSGESSASGTAGQTSTSETSAPAITPN